MDLRQIDLMVQAKGGWMPVKMEVLRDAVWAGKLGVHVLERIQRKLDAYGLVVLGGELPSDQRETVWLISRRVRGGRMLLDLLDMIDESCSDEAAA